MNKFTRFCLDLIAMILSWIGYFIAWVCIGLFWVVMLVSLGMFYIVALPLLIVKQLWVMITTGKFCHGVNISIKDK